MKKIFEKFKKFMFEKKDYFLVSAIVIFVFGLVLALNGCFPFGDRTILMGDAYAQIGAFIGHIFNVLQGKSTLFYTNYLAGGVEIFSTLEYMYFNPFYLIALLGGKNNIYYMMNFSVMFMFVFNAIVFYWFSKKYFPNVKKLARVLLTLFFAFSPFAAANFTFVTWLIYPAISLLLADRFLNLVNHGKICGFIVVMVWFVVTCFSVGVSSNIILIVLFAAYIFLMKEKGDRKPILVRLFIAYLISVFIAVAILFPSIVAFLKTARGTLSLSSLFKGGYDNKTSTRFTFVVLFGAVLLFAVLYFIKCNKKEQKNKFYLFASILSVLIVLFGVSGDLLCGGFCNGLYYRFGFIFTVIISIITLEFFTANFEIKTKEYTKLSLYNVIYGSLIFILLFSFLWWCVLCFSKFGIGFKSIYGNDGFDKATLFLFGIMIIVFLLILLMTKRGLLSKKIYNAMISFIMIFTLAVSFVSVGISAYSKHEHNDLKKITYKLDCNSRIKTADENLTGMHLNSLDLNVRNISYFSSLIPSTTVDSYKSLGYSYSPVVVIGSKSGNIITDSLMGVKYFVCYKERNVPYLKFVEKNGDYILYENTLASTGAIVFDENFSYDSGLNYLENFVKIKEMFGVSGELYANVSPKSERIETDDRYENIVVKHTYTAETDGILYINKGIYTFDKEQNKKAIEYLSEYVDVEKMYLFDEKSQDVLNELMYIKSGETVEFYTIEPAEEYSENRDFKFIDYSVAEEVCKKLQERSAKLEFSKDGYKVNLNGLSGKLVVFNPDIDGMFYQIDGKEVEASHAFGGFSMFDVDENTKVLKAKYDSKIGIIWIFVIMISLLVSLLILALYKKTKFKPLEKIIEWVFFVANCCILLVFVGFGIFLTIFRTIL